MVFRVINFLERRETELGNGGSKCTAIAPAPKIVTQRRN